jgi:N-acetylglucosaminyldiphosphoundecaprenol N-acetyl-beta-D-mannosaminyltransferase
MTLPRPPRRYVLGFPLDPVTLDQAARWIVREAQAPSREPAGAGRLVVTLNPEIVAQASSDEPLATALRHADLSVADGVGIAWAARRTGEPLPGRVPGVDLVAEAMRLGGERLRVYFLGGKPGVAEAAADAARERFGVTVAGAHHGYFRRPGETGAVCAAVRAAAPDLLLAGLGEGQERFLAEHAEELATPVMIGVGGTLDVLAGNVKRMPAWTSRWGVEWVFRVASDRRRWRRAPRLARFVWLVLRHRDDEPRP